jgi:ABC-type Fe3+-hydroxamate transport system substrate-binding protein
MNSSEKSKKLIKAYRKKIARAKKKMKNKEDL